MPVIIFSEIRHFGTDESRQTAKLSGIVTDEGKRTFPFYLSDTIRNTQYDKMKQNARPHYLTICDRTGSLALIRHGTSSIAINTTFGLVPRHLPLGGRHPYGITFRHHQKKNDCFSTNRGGQHELSASDCRKSPNAIYSGQRLTKS